MTSNELAIRLSDRPADHLVRVHTERTDWDEPRVRYLRRTRPDLGHSAPLRLYRPDGNEEFVLNFGKVHVHIHADEDHIRIVLREPPEAPRAA